MTKLEKHKNTLVAIVIYAGVEEAITLQESESLKWELEIQKECAQEIQRIRQDRWIVRLCVSKNDTKLRSL